MIFNLPYYHLKNKAMKKLSFFLLALLIASHSFGQNLQNANWCFGYHAGVNFNTTPPTPTTSALIGAGGFDGASVSDDNGQLLFYTDGIKVWDRNHNIMPNGNMLWGWTNETIAQKTVIVPKPNYPGIYYIFTLSTKDRWWLDPDPPQGRGGLHYTVVNMNLNLGLGDVEPSLKNVQMNDHKGLPIEYDLTTQQGNYINQSTKMTTTLHANEDKIWLCIFPEFEENPTASRYFYTYLISENGIDNKPDGQIPNPYSWQYLNGTSLYNRQFDAGTIKVAPNKQLLAEADSDDGVKLYTFNNQNGNLAFSRLLHPPPPPPFTDYVGIGLEFSPNSQLIYFSEVPNYIIQTDRPQFIDKSKKFKTIFQYDLISENKNEVTKIEVPEKNIPQGPVYFPINSPWGLQLGIDNKIYSCALGYLNGENLPYWLGTIQNPDVPGTGCNYTPFGIRLLFGTQHSTKLPQWVHKVRKEPWPKSYAAWNDYIVKDNFGNIFSYYSSGDIRTNVNHNGVLPSNPGDFTVQYNKANGITSWVKQDLMPLFALNSGDIQMRNSSNPIITSFFNATTGQPSSSPPLVPANEQIIAETNSGGFITISGNNINVHTNLGSTTTPFIPFATSIFKSFFNLNSQKLFIEYYNLNTFYSTLAVYQLTNNNLSLINNPSFQDYPGIIIQVNNNDMVYTLGYDFISGTNRINQYDYINKQNSAIIIPGFNNNHLFIEAHFCNRYTENGILCAKFDENKIYSINTSTSQFKKIPYSFSTNLPYPPVWNNIYDGNDIYLIGIVDGSPMGNLIIGTQTIFFYPNQSSYITKLNLITDFERPAQSNIVSSSNMFERGNLSNSLSEESEQIDIFPNPATDLVTITSSKNSITNIQLSDMYNNVVLRKSFNDSKNINFSVNNLMPGVYYCSIKTKNGVVVNKKVVVLRQ